MNYLRLINQFWLLRRSKRITSKQTDLYFFLIQECNQKNWDNPFECANKLIIASIDITEPTLIDARNRLKQIGLIDFLSGKKNEASPIYTILYLNDLSRNRGTSLVTSLVETEESDEHTNKQNKTRQERAGTKIFDAEKAVLENPIEFERICLVCGRPPDHAKAALRKYHLWLAENEKYPRSRSSVFAGFEKWLSSERPQLTNGHQLVNTWQKTEKDSW